jgi:diacylglycerol kinase (ATP)
MKNNYPKDSLPPKYLKYNPITSLYFAFSGIFWAFGRENSIKIQFLLGFVVVLLAIMTNHFYLAMSNFILMSVIISLEMINTAIELICDMIEPKTNLTIKTIKDLTAGAVLVVACSWGMVILYLFYTILF